MSMPSCISALYTSSAERWRTLLASKSSRILRRGSVALSPLSFRLCTVLIDYHYMPMLRATQAAAALLLSASLAGCGVPRPLGIAPYKIEVQQGNFVSKDMVDQLKEGMSKEQVRQIMGTPLLVDIFHGERWDYIYTRETTDGKKEKRTFVVYFQDSKLTRFAG